MGLALVAAVVTARAAGGGGGGRPIVVARQAVPAGTLFDARAGDALLAVARAPAGLDLPGLIRDPSGVLGHRTAVPLAAGEPVTDAALGGAPGAGPGPLLPGERAVPVPLAAAGGAGAGLSPGARVDVVASTGEGAAGRSRVVVADAEVLGVTQGAGADSGLPEGGSAILRVSEGAALRLTAALNFARDVRLLLRPVGEAPRAHGGPLPAAGAP
jgi:Flp pilus assembly protein CpaB